MVGGSTSSTVTRNEHDAKFELVSDVLHVTTVGAVAGYMYGTGISQVAGKAYTLSLTDSGMAWL